MLYRPKHEEGQGLVEYALIIALVGVAIIAVLSLMSPAIGNIYSNIIDSMGNAIAGI